MAREDAVKNVQMKVVRSGHTSTRLVITVDLDQRFGESKSGKSVIVATTGGNVRVPEVEEELMVGVNVYEKVR